MKMEKIKTNKGAVLYKTKKYIHFVMELKSGKFLAQLSDNTNKATDPHKLHAKIHILEHTDTVEDALKLVGWDVELFGIPKELS